MGMMKVVTGMSNHRPSQVEAEPTWDEAVAELEAGAPAEVVRSARSVAVEYRYSDGVWRATSPDIVGFVATGQTFAEVKTHAREDLASYLDAAVSIDERCVQQAGVTLGVSRKVVIFEGLAESLASASGFLAVLSPSRATRA